MDVAVDTETTGLNWANGDYPFSVAFYFEDHSTQYFEAPVDPLTRLPKWSTIDLEAIRAIVSNPTYRKLFANGKFDMHMLETIDIKTEGEYDDVLIMARVCNTLEKNVNLKYLSKTFVGVTTDDEKALKDAVIKARKTGKEKGWKCGSPHYDVAQDYWLLRALDKNNFLNKVYNLADVKRTFRLAQFYREGLKALKRQKTYEFEMEVMRNIYEIEKVGLKANEDLINQRLLETNTTIFQTEAKFKKLGVENLNSDQQLVKYVQSLGVHLTDRTEPSKTFPEGQLRINNRIMQRHIDSHPEIIEILKYKAAATARGYFMNYLQFLTSEKIIHANLHQFKTNTFRLSASDPNVQNITSAATNDNPYSIDARCVFGPRPGYYWIAIDYEQLELRIFASRGNVTRLINAFNSGGDPHNETRLAIPYLAAKDPKPGRKIAKNVNFTVINCGGKAVLWEKYGVPLNEGAEVIKGFYEANPEAKTRQREAEQYGRKHGYIYNAYNRKLDVDSHYAYRATSYDIQGSAADLIKRAIIVLNRFMAKNFSPEECRILLQVHDELVFEIRQDIYDVSIISAIAQIMSNNYGAFCVQTPVSASLITDNWSSKEEINLNAA